MKSLRFLATITILTIFTFCANLAPAIGQTLPVQRQSSAATTTPPLRCVAFSPYVNGYNPDYGPHPTHAVIDALLDVVVHQLGFGCIMTYGVLNGLDYTFEAAQARGLKVIAILYLDTNTTVNAASIAKGIEVAKQYPGTIVRMACGSEVRVRHGAATAEPIIRDCLTKLKNAGVTQPLTSIDTWWGWCNETWPCQVWGLSSEVDWIGINIFPWWENKYSGLFPCTTAAQAADFHIARFQDIRTRYPGKEVIVTEFGWPAGPDGATEANQNTGQTCGVASESNQQMVIRQTLAKLDTAGLPGVVFSAFRETWKTDHEGSIGAYWGVCLNTSPYACKYAYGFAHHVYVPATMRN